MMSHNCEWCGADLPPSRAGRRFCEDACRKRAARGAVEIVPTDGPVTAAIGRLLDELGDVATIDVARGALALALGRQVDGGSVPASRELRALLADFENLEREELVRWRATVQTPRPPAGSRDQAPPSP